LAGHCQVLPGFYMSASKTIVLALHQLYR